MPDLIIIIIIIIHKESQSIVFELPEKIFCITEQCEQAAAH